MKPTVLALQEDSRRAPLSNFCRRLLAAVLLFAAPIAAQAVAHSPALTISGDVAKPVSLSLADFSALPHKTLKVTNPHDQKDEVYERVPLADLLRIAGAPSGDKLRGAALATYVVEAADGYRVVFSLAELDPGIQDSNVIVADKLDGRPLDDKLGPLRLVAPR
jgi:hypothetical protein